MMMCFGMESNLRKSAVHSQLFVEDVEEEYIPSSSESDPDDPDYTSSCFETTVETKGFAVP